MLLRPQSDPVWESRCFFFSLPRAVAETFRFLELCWLLFLLLLLSQLFVGVVV